MCIRDSGYATLDGPEDRGKHQSEMVQLDKNRILISLGQHKNHRRLVIVDLSLIHISLFSVMDGASVAVAVDGDFPSLCSFRGLPVVTLFSTRLPDVYRPMPSANLFNKKI